ncbi:hypothetical protein QE441_003351 [Chryseobacterium sp. SORGH_AS909]|uniref:Uncharacterized protein n=1 Tax=Chryseobacterium camelliae TaxID=1265445 RepID=A0ABU0TJ26_9FLAO|nr:hypothetical protein [Chryseobacterium camelliae]MDQ1100212.1 hypothetical protein [Chryseobacterium sp. SORGH_AS_1048]MDR6087557.1 hypothetical protein [Chryseobacterium sp. SORGH_AS_0909]MDR6131931.1 hypothetical protein [Chryseobacterium sp. SORGH_AS_1175]MDT3405920.1 hypothetical protein [Pseudacidovorax intermedius]
MKTYFGKQFERYCSSKRTRVEFKIREIVNIKKFRS